MQISGPIPGESLTKEKGNAPWEQPPQFSRVDEAFRYYLEQLEDEEYFEDLLSVLDEGLPLDLLVDSLLLNGEARGRHFVDTSMLLGPLLHEYILGLAEAADINVIEFQSQLGESLSSKDVDLFQTMFADAIADNTNDSELSGALDNLEEASEGSGEPTEGVEAPLVDEPPSDLTSPPMAPPGASTGLIGRPTNVA